MSRTAHANSEFRPFILSIGAVVLAALLVLAGCDIIGVDEDDEAQGPIETIAISPDSISIEVGEQVDFSVAAVTASGDTVPDADLNLRWWSTDTTVFTVEDDGLATGQGSGTAYCMVEADDETETAGKRAVTSRPDRFVGRDSAFIRLF